jgi:putative ribosome biogenesis GTPase RsgA
MQANLNWSQSTASTVDFLNFKELVKFGKERVSELATTPSHDKDSLTIVPNNESFIQLAECAEERVAHTISFIGPTHVGKSTIVRAMMGLDPFPAAPE